MKAIFLAISLFFISNANATVTLWQAAGVFQYQQQNQPMRAQAFDESAFLSESACNAAIAGYGNMLDDGSVTPGNQQNSRSKLDAVCHSIIPPQLPGWYALGQMQVQQSGQAAQPLHLKLGPFGNYPACQAALNRQKTLTLGNTPITDQNVAYKLDGDCYKLMD